MAYSVDHCLSRLNFFFILILCAEGYFAEQKHDNFIIMLKSNYDFVDIDSSILQCMTLDNADDFHTCSRNVIRKTYTYDI